MEFCEGLTLREKISEGPMAPREAATLIAKLARTLAHAHEAGVLHRDLKPANIILAPDHPKITDFGLARDRSLQRSLTKTGDLLGTPYYMAPELFREGAKDLGHHLDIYSLGVVLYECLTGVRPFQAATPMLLAQRICRDQPTRPSELNPSVSPGLDAICKLAMAKKPGDRYVNMREFADDLELDLRGKSPMASQDISRRRKRPGTARGGRRNTILMASAAIAIALPLVTWFTVNTVRRNARHAAARELLGRTDAARADLERAAGLAAGDDALLTLARHALRKADARVRLEEAAQLAEREPPPALAVEGRLEEAATLADGDPAILREVKAIRRRMVARIALVKARRSSKEPGFHEEVAKAFEQAIGLTLPPDRELLELERLEYFYVHGRQEEVCALAPLLERNDTVGPRAMFFHALALEEVGRVDEMRRLMERLAEDKTTAIGLTAGAFLAFIADDFRGALRLSDAAVEIDASFPPTVRIQALALVGTGQAEQAEMRLKTIEDVAGDWPRVLRLKLILHSKLGRTRDALRAAERMVEMSEPTPTAHALASCGQARMMLGDHASAIPYFDRALTVDETLINSRVLRGLAYHLGRQTQRAVTDWRKADASNPAAFEASLQEINPRRLREDILSLTRGQQGPGGPNAPPISFGEVSANAVTVLETRWNRAPQAAQKALEQALRKAAGASQWWELKKIFDAARDAAPDSGVVALERVRALVGRTANTEAWAAIRAARKTDASPHELDRLRAETLLFSGDTPEALSAFQAVAQADPSGLNGHCASAEAALIQRNFKKADAEARAALEIDPKHVPSMILRVFAMNTQPRQALQIARQAFDLEGLMNSRLFLAHSLASIRSLMMNLLRGRSDPREGMKVMTDTRALFDLSEGAYSRLLLCDEVLRVRLPFAFAPLTAWIEQQLKAAEAAEPDRAHVHVLLGTMQLTGGGSAESVIKAWQKAKALDPKADLGPWTSEFDRRFGATPELKALLR